MIKKSFTLRVLVISFLFLALPLLVDTFIFFQNSYSDSIAEAKAQLKSESNYRIYNLMGIRPIKQVLIRELTYILDLKNTIENPNQETLNRALEEVAHVSGEFQMYILKIETPYLFKIIASSKPSATNNFFASYRLLPGMIKEGQGTFVRYNYSADEHKYVPYLFIVEVINSSKTNQPIGMFLIEANIENQLATVIAKPPVQDNISFAILNEDGIVIEATDASLRGQYFEALSESKRHQILDSGQFGLEKLAQEPLRVIRNQDTPFFEFIFQNQAQIAYRSYAPVGNISILSYASKEVFFGTAVGHFLFIYTVYGLILVVGGGVTYWLALWISRPLRQLTHTMIEVGKGNLEARFQEKPFGFEINILGRVFNQTLDNLLENIQYAEDERVKKETYQRELSIIRKVQKSLLPSRTPAISGAQFASIYLPAVDVGGDYYGYLIKKTHTGEEALVISVADAAGKGLSSCLYALSARSLFRTNAMLSDDIGHILNVANQDFIHYAAGTEMFIRIFLAMYRTESKIFSYCACGEIPGFVKRADGQIIDLKYGKTAIGLSQNVTYAFENFQLMQGDIVVLYTNAILEAVNEKQEAFTEVRLKNLVHSKEFQSAQEIIDTIGFALQEFTQSIPQKEEIICVVLKIEDDRRKNG